MCVHAKDGKSVSLCRLLRRESRALVVHTFVVWYRLIWMLCSMCIEWVSLSLCMGQHNCCEHVVCLKAVVGFSHLCTVSSESYPHNKNRSFSIPGAFMRYWRTEHSHTSQKLNKISNYFGFEAIWCYRNTLETSSINKTKKKHREVPNRRAQSDENRITLYLSNKKRHPKGVKIHSRQTGDNLDNRSNWIVCFSFCFFFFNYKCRYSLVWNNFRFVFICALVNRKRSTLTSVREKKNHPHSNNNSAIA